MVWGPTPCLSVSALLRQLTKRAKSPGQGPSSAGLGYHKPNQLFWKNIGLRGGSASVTTHDRKVLLDAVLKDQIHPGKVFTKRFDLDHVQEAYGAMDQRQAIKSLIIVSQ